MGLVIFLVVLAIAAVVVRAVIKANQRKAAERKEAELEPVRKLAFEDVTAFGEELQVLDVDMAGRALEPGEHADYQRALDSYESAKRAADRITEPEHVKGVTEIVEDGKYAMACVRARVDGLPAAHPASAVLLRPAPRPVGRGRSLRTARWCRA